MVSRGLSAIRQKGDAGVLTGAQFQVPSSPQLHNAYTMGRPVPSKACDILAYLL